MVGYIIKSNQTNPYYNLAFEEYLLEYVKKVSSPILYLWQNDNTVVIGRNQNAYTECDIQYAEIQGINIVRRLTGGGAVYHDLGNLNYTIILPKPMYDIEKSTKIILYALQKFGVDANANGRNDICVRGKKISGNAYYSNIFAGIHHGTILFNVDMEKLEKVLRVSKEKILKRGIESIHSRVINLKELYPFLTIGLLQNEIEKQFQKRYDIKEFDKNIHVNTEKLDLYLNKYKSKEWNIDLINDYKLQISRQYIWGIVTMSFDMTGDKIDHFEISTDSLETNLIERIRNSINLHIKSKNIKGFDNVFIKCKRDFGEKEKIIIDIESVFYELWDRVR